MKKIKFDLKAAVKLVLALSLLGVYWYWISQTLITESNNAFGLTTFFLLMCTATAYFPLPANLLVLGAVLAYEPEVVALVAGLATLVAYLSEYIFFSILFRFNKISKFKQTWIYQKIQPLFDKHRFFMLSFTSFLPIPAEALRIYAITQRYSLLLFVLAGFIGRIPRYFLLGYYGKEYVNSPWFLALVFIFPAFFLFVIRAIVSLVSFIKQRYSRSRIEISEPAQPASD